jgi:hypothetical protein
MLHGNDSQIALHRSFDISWLPDFAVTLRGAQAVTAWPTVA